MSGNPVNYVDPNGLFLRRYYHQVARFVREPIRTIRNAWRDFFPRERRPADPNASVPSEIPRAGDPPPTIPVPALPPNQYSDSEDDGNVVPFPGTTTGTDGEVCEDEEDDCEELYATDTTTCNGISRVRGKRAGAICHASASERYSACLSGRPIPPLSTWNN